MGILEKQKAPDLAEGYALYQKTAGAVLVDVRAPSEYGQGHLPGSVNLPLQALAQIETIAPSKETPLFLYCVSGGRSERAAKALQRLGYANAVSIGGVNGYSGVLE